MHVAVPNPMRYNLTIDTKNRGRQIIATQRGVEYNYVIPVRELGEFWNTAVANNLEALRKTLVFGLWHATEKYPRVEPSPEQASVVADKAIRLLKMIWGRTYVHDAGVNVTPPPDRMLHEFKVIYIWMPGNLFGGPTVPGDQFDVRAERLLERGRYQTVLRAHRAIEQYLGQRPLSDSLASAAGLQLALVA
jgi:hypothetical protein